MSELLARYETQLEEHFGKLAALRSAAGGVVFALEHDLEPAVWTTIAQALRAALKHGSPRSEHWLLWVVYAAEQGYYFDGEEYWQSFEADTPLWRVWGSRHQIRSWFRRFQKRFAGIEPQGAWAHHFSIICWPITHAVLPRDLQFQFARTLHHARYSLVSARSTEAKVLGRLVKREAWHGSSRFQQFAQHEELVGRLVLAILGAEEAEGDRILLGSTLNRVVADLERIRQAKDWLESARRAVTRFKGAASGDGAGGRTPSARPLQETKPRPPSIRPTLILRRSASLKWDVGAEVPSFADFAREIEGLREFLLRTRSTINGGDGSWTPSSWLLGSGREKVLLEWPNVREPIVQFEARHEHLQILLSDDGTLTPGPLWICRIGDDGTATEVLGRQVRPGERYVLLHDGSATLDSPLISDCEVNCRGISACLLTLPKAVTPDDEAFLAKLSLPVSRTVRIWPAGLAARRWDGEGSGEWLTTETPCFGVQHDHALSHYAVSLNSSAETTLAAGQPGQVIFFSLPRLTTGEHILRVRAIGGKAEQSPLEGLVAVAVREPASWVPGTTAHGGLAVVSDPGLPNLDDLLSDRLSVAVQGPDARRVDLSLRTLKPPGETALLNRQVRLPAKLSNWGRLLGESAEEELAVASRAELLIEGGELGVFRIELERDAKPLRWSVRRHPTTVLRLIDESDSDNLPDVRWSSLSYPLESERLDVDQCREGLQLAPPGGLFMVRGEGCEDSIIVSVPPPGPQHGFEALGIAPRIRPGPPGRVGDLLVASLAWRAARAVGALAPTRKATVVQFLDDHLMAQFCGNDWVLAEARTRSKLDDNSLSKLGEGLGNTFDAKGFSAALRRSPAEIAEGDAHQQSSWFADVAGRYNICKDRGLAQTAFRLARNPLQAFSDPASEMETVVSQLSELSVLMRGARLANHVLASRVQA